MQKKASTARDLQKQFLRETAKHGKQLGAHLDEMDGDPYGKHQQEMYEDDNDLGISGKQDEDVNVRGLRVNIEDMLMDEKVYATQKTSRKDWNKFVESDSDDDDISGQSSEESDQKEENQNDYEQDSDSDQSSE